MPRESKRKVFMRSLASLFNKRIKGRAIRTLFNDEDSTEDVKDLVLLRIIKSADSRRYLFRRPNYRKGVDRFSQDLVDDDDSSSADSNINVETFEQDVADEAAKMAWLTDDEFLQKYRTTRESFSRILGLTQDHPVFNVDETKPGRKQAPPVHQLMVFLKFLGTEGSGGSNSNQRHAFSIGYGTADVYRTRVTKAIMSLREKYLHWPDEEERKQIGRETHAKCGFPHCIGIGDGTLFPLAFEPQTEDAPDYSGRKFGYSLSTLIFCDHKKRIRHYLSGYPGSAHDNRVYKGTDLRQKPTKFFSPRQCVVGDSAFENDPHMVSAFKKLPNTALQASHEDFNTKLAKLRIISEHCIGILKGRFPWLRSIRLLITEDKKSLKRILQLIDASIILHNILIDFGEEEREDWIDLDDFSDMDDAERAPHREDDELNLGIPGWAEKDARRTQLLNYFLEYYFL